MKKVSVIIPAAGIGKRMGKSVSKQFLMLKGIPLFIHTIKIFELHPKVDKIVVVVPDFMVSHVKELMVEFEIHKVSDVLAGGEHRQDSVINGFQALNPEPDDIVIIHDAVRPFVSISEISRCIEAAEQCGAAAVAIQPKDTIKTSVENEYFESTLDRGHLWSVQTPQIFRSDILGEAFRHAKSAGFYGTDDAQLVEKTGIKVKIIPGSYDNIKITTPEDLELAKLIIKRRMNMKEN